MSAVLQAARSWLLWHLPVSAGEARRLQEQIDAHDAKIAAIFEAMRRAGEYAGIPMDALASAGGHLTLVSSEEFANVVARLDAQDEAWTAWRTVNGRTPPPRPGLRLMKGGVS